MYGNVGTLGGGVILLGAAVTVLCVDSLPPRPRHQLIARFSWALEGHDNLSAVQSSLVQVHTEYTEFREQSTLVPISPLVPAYTLLIECGLLRC